uniref:Protein DBF4 homolog B isoform X2 n=1 Tax=Geotrypetes seraphini TaxID=260995 RepID=A0A6P8NVF1_GEOSA|nr:protein DBF4 homolog B isoform X2 [Geotrypetes seraphini]
MADANPVAADLETYKAFLDVTRQRHPLTKMSEISVSAKNRPFSGKSFYLDLPNNKNTQFLIRTIKKLGGVIESFLSKEVTYVVSNNNFRERRDANLTELQHTQIFREMKVDLPSNTLKDSSAKLQQQKPTDNHAHFSRGKELLQKAIGNQDAFGGSSLLANAQSWGVHILHTTELLDFVKQPSLEERCLGTGVKFLKVMKLKSPFLKIEDTSRLFRPLHHRFQCFPELNYLAPRGVNPYKQQKFLSSSHKLGKTEDPVGHATHGEREEEERNLKLAPTALKRKKGFCECCRQTFQELDMHLQSEPHLCFAQDSTQYVPVDRIISQFTDYFVELPATSTCRSLDHSPKICFAQDLEHDGSVKDTKTALSSGLEFWRNHNVKRENVQKPLNELLGPEHDVVDQAMKMVKAATPGKPDYINQSLLCVQELSHGVEESVAKGDFPLQDISEFTVVQTQKEEMGLDDALSFCSGNMDGLKMTSFTDTVVTETILTKSCSSTLEKAYDGNLKSPHKVETPTSYECNETLLLARKRKRLSNPDLHAACVCDSTELAGWDATHLCEKRTVERLNTKDPSLLETECLLPDLKRLCSSTSSVLALAAQQNLSEHLHHGQAHDNVELSMSNHQRVALELTAKEQPVNADLSLICSANASLLGHQFPVCLNDNSQVAQFAIHELQNIESETYAKNYSAKVADSADLQCMGLPSLTSCKEQELVVMEQPRTQVPNTPVWESSVQTGTGLLLGGRFSSESEWDIQFLTSLDQMQATRGHNLDVEVLRRTCISMQDSGYESHLCSVLQQKSEQDWASKEKSLTNCRTETGIPFTLLDACLDGWTS